MAELSLVEVRELRLRLRAVEDAMADEQTTTLSRDDPAWLQVPPAKREVAVARLKVLRAFEAKDAPTKSDALAAAAELNLKLRSFYALLREWRNKGKTLLALVPYGGIVPSTRPSRLDPEVAEKLTVEIRTLLADNPSIRPGEAVRTIESTWPKALKPPSSVTVRNYLERLKADQPAKPGSFRLTIGTPTGQRTETASRFGETIVIDHAAPARLLLGDDHNAESATAPTITLAIDLWSGVPIGAAVRGGEPGPDALLDALADAKARTEGLGREAVEPRLVYHSTATPEWDSLRDRLHADGVEIAEQRDHRLLCGGPIKRLLGAKLGEIPLQALRNRRLDVDRLDPKEDALLTLREARFVVNASLDRLVQARLVKLVVRDGGELAIPTRIARRGSLKEQCVPLIKHRRRAQQGASEKVSSAAIDNIEAPNDRLPLETELRKMVDAVGGPLVTDLHVEAPDRSSPGWSVSVIVSDAREVPSLWLRLAREAIRLEEMQGINVRFAVAPGADA